MAITLEHTVTGIEDKGITPFYFKNEKQNPVAQKRSNFSLS